MSEKRRFCFLLGLLVSFFAETQTNQVLQFFPEPSFNRNELEEFYLGGASLDEPSKTPSPSTTIQNPSGFSSQWGNLGGGIAYIERNRYGTRPVLGVGLGAGYGNPDRHVGGSLSLGSGNYLDSQSKFFTLSANIGTHFRNGLGVNLGIGNLLSVLDGKKASVPMSPSLAIGKSFMFSEKRKYLNGVALHGGVGSGSFSTESNETKITNKKKKFSLNFFGGAALKIVPSTNFIVEWSGQDLNAGVSYSFMPGAGVNLAYLDITRVAGDGPRFLASVYYAFSFL